MSAYPFNPDDLSNAAKEAMAASDDAGRLKLANQLRADLKAFPNTTNHIALAWTLTEIVESGVFIDDLWSDIQEAQASLEQALVLDPKLESDAAFIEQHEKTDILLGRVAEFEEGRQKKIAASKRKTPENISAKQAAEIAYASKDPEEVAQYFLIAAKKTRETNPAQAEWYLNGRTGALLDLELWDEAQPQLQKMTKGNTYGDPRIDQMWIEQGYVGLLRIAAARSDVRSFRKIWKAARSASPAIPGSRPEYFRILGFGIENDLFDFIEPVFKSLKENKEYKKTKEEEGLLELASEKIENGAPRTLLGKLLSFTKRSK